MKIPERFKAVTGRRSLLLVRSDLADRVIRAGILDFSDPMRWDGISGSIRGGRGVLNRLRLPGDPEVRILVKLMKRGGLHGIFNRGLHFSSSRLFQQARLSEFLRCHDVPTVEMLFGRAERVVGPIYRLHLGTREAVNTRSLLDCLRDEQASMPDDRGPGAARAAFLHAGRLVRRLHDSGVHHADLNLSNILVAQPDGQEGEPGARIIDLDGSRLPAGNSSGKPAHQGGLPEDRRLGNLARFLRHAVKSGLLDGIDFGRLWLSFLQGYCGEDDPETLNRRVIKKFRTTLPFHRISWRIQGINVPADPFRS